MSTKLSFDADPGYRPDDVSAFEFNVSAPAGVKRDDLPDRLTAFRLTWRDFPLPAWPVEWTVRQQLDLSDSDQLMTLPDGFAVSVLILRNCRSLTALPEGLRVDYLDITGCTGLREIPASAEIGPGRLIARDCTGLRALPARMGPLSSLDLAGCRQMDSIPSGADVRSWIDIAGTAITSLPEALKGIGLRWRGVAVDARIAFFPEAITSAEALEEPNAEVRRVMIERMGFERFLAEAKAQVLHEDTDAGGARQLLLVPLQGDEPLVVVSVRCPSTGRHYLIRVPPGMKTCRQAVAWTAGFDNADDYQPLAET